MNFLEDAIGHWLVSFMNKNEDQVSIAQHKHAMLKGIQDDLVGVGVK